VPELLAEARADLQILATPGRSSEWPQARTRYNLAVARLFDNLRCGPDGWVTRAGAIGTRIAVEDPSAIDPDGMDAMFPASSVKDDVLKARRYCDGVGVPVVGWKQTPPVGQKREKYQLPSGLPYNLTAMLDFSGEGSPRWRFIKRIRHDETRIGSATHTLAADWSATNNFYWHMCDLDNLKIENVLLPDRFTEETGIYFVTPYDPDKIPVVFVHGLVSSPDAFKNVINELVPEPWFRQHYQIWLYNYPTGNPWIISAMNFREKMREACVHARTKGGDANLERMVVVAHSMGGLLTRSSITDPKHVLYDEFFRKPLDELKTNGETRALIRDSLLYEPITEPDRVVFLAVPHRGSPMANRTLAMWLSKLIRLPKTLTIELLDTTLLSVGDAIKGEEPEKPLPTSINSLSPQTPSTIALNKLPLPKHITFHSVIGDRGKGDSPDSSDGVVPYWSSHVEPVASELIIPSNHSVPDNPQAAEELKRILKLHLENKN
jgi:hypothetical protein